LKASTTPLAAGMADVEEKQRNLVTVALKLGMTTPDVILSATQFIYKPRQVTWSVRRLWEYLRN
jgi:hypothetical protein